MPKHPVAASAAPPGANGAAGGGEPRSLADQLRAWSDDELAALVQARPDLGVPLPPDLTSLAGRVANRASVQRALDGLDTPTLQVLEVLATLPEPTTVAQVTRGWGAPAGPALERLRALALVWGTPKALRLVRSVADLLGPHPAGLGPTLADALGRRSPQRLAELLEDLDLPPSGDPDTALHRLAGELGKPTVITDLLARAPDGVREVLDRLTWGPPIGQVPQADRVVRRSSAAGPIDWLLAHGMLAVADPGHVVLPREVALALRGGRVHPDDNVVVQPALNVTARSTRMVRSTAAGAAAEAVRLIEALCELFSLAPAPVLRAGGLGVRELRRTATQLDLDDVTAAIVVELAFAAGLIADNGELDPRWAPTPAYDGWRTQSTGDRWATLVVAWLQTTRCPGLVGSRDARDTARSALGGDLDRASAPEVRRWVLETLADLAPGEAADPASLRARLTWLAPRRASPLREAMIDWALHEAAWLGVTGAGALAPAARPLLADAPDRTDQSGRPDQAGDAAAAAADLLDDALPEPIDHVLLQADLTAVAPGALEPALARWLSVIADVESRGGATVYRFSPESVRRALDAGLAADDLVARLARHSRTEVPQPLHYLIYDTARRHGKVRVGAAQSYVRADDESALAELLADRRAAMLRLRRLAPTVLAAQAPGKEVLDVLRSMGLAPAAETPEGDILLRRPLEHRTPPRTRPRPLSPLPPPPSAPALLSAVQALRSADEALAGRIRAGQNEAVDVDRAPALAIMDPTGVLAVLRDAVNERRTVWIGYVDASGLATRRLVDPVSVEAGRVSAFDRGADQLRTFSVHRVTGVAHSADEIVGGER